MAYKLFGRSRRFSSRSLSAGRYDHGIVLGLGLTIGLMALGVALGGNGIQFVSPVSFLIVVGGTIGAALINFSTADMRSARDAFKQVILISDRHPSERIDLLLGLAQQSRQEGLLCLERAAERTNDPFLKLACELTVDGQKHEDVRRMLETEMRASNDRALRAVQVFEAMATYAPAMGLIGTLIGLIQMLGALDRPETVGPAMAVALITTLYGALLTNVLFTPIAGKLKNRNAEEALLKSITVEGVISIGKQENPIVVEQRLQSFVPLAG